MPLRKHQRFLRRPGTLLHYHGGVPFIPSYRLFLYRDRSRIGLGIWMPGLWQDVKVYVAHCRATTTRTGRTITAPRRLFTYFICDMSMMIVAIAKPGICVG